ncbi:MAG: rod shape-determining protein MreC [Bacillota bacterium]|nr:rod shape-determining protein MreC [Bacillota bacterium]
MSRNSGRKKLFWTVAAVLVLIGVIRFTAVERMNLSPVEEILQELLAPLQSGASAVVENFSKNIGAIGNYRQTQEENERLKAELARLSEELNILEEARLENFRLRNLLEFRESLYESYGEGGVPAKVIGRSAGNWLQTITIDKGRNNGIQRNMAVVAPAGLVGRVISVTPNTAQVLLILDRDGAVGGMLQISRTPGVAEGMGDGTGRLQLVYLPHDTVSRPNQVVITSGLHGLFPKGLRIGYVTEMRLEPNGLLKYAIVQPFVDFDRLEEVIVLPLIDYIDELDQEYNEEFEQEEE